MQLPRPSQWCQTMAARPRVLQPSTDVLCNARQPVLQAAVPPSAALCLSVQADQDRSGVIDFQEFVALFIALTKKSALGVQEAKTILLQRCAPCGCSIPDLCRPPCPTCAHVATTKCSVSRQQSGPACYTYTGRPCRPVNRARSV